MAILARRRSFFFSIVAVTVVAWSISSAPVSASEVVLEDDALLVAFDSDSGALTRLENKATHWAIERRPELGVSFRMHAPLPDRRDNFILGQKQKAAEVKKVSDNEVDLKWTDLTSEHGGVLPITLSAKVTLDHGALTFATTLENKSKLVVETVDYPYLGDLNPPSRDVHLDFRHINYDQFNSDSLYPAFPNYTGYWGVDFPLQTYSTNYTVFGLIQSAKEGLYLEMADPTQPYLVQWTFEQHPGVRDTITNQVPQSDTISGLPVHLDFRACHFVFAKPQATVKFAPIVLHAYSGDWHAGVDLYKQWRATWFKPAKLPEWISEVNSWQQLQINSPEQNYRVQYKDLVSYGEECAKNGVAAIQLVGWNHGGQDGGNPSQDTDPGLGTWQDLHDAIAKIQADGVKIMLFGKFNWSDRSTAWNKKELTNYAITDMNGDKYGHGGYSYWTPTQLAQINTHSFDIMDFLSPAYRAIIAKEFQKDLALGSAGFLWDEVFHHGPAMYNFSPNHGYTPPGYVYSADVIVAHQMRDAADKARADFVFAGESPNDWQRQFFPCAYFRIGGSNTPVTRYIDPQEPLMIAATGFDDREMLNFALLDRYIISYEPYNFKGRITDFPLTLEYGKKIDALRRKYKAYLWDAEFRDTIGATVDGTSHYSVFVTPSGKRAVVVVNMDSDKTITAKVNLPNAGTLVAASPEDAEAKPCTGSVDIPTRSAAVVMEQ